MMDRRRALIGAASGGGYEHGTWEDLFRTIDAGTYKAEYSLGEKILLDIGTDGVVSMQIVKFDGDVTPENEQIPVSLVAVELLTTSRRYNPAQDGETVGTGNIGGWEHSELREYLNTTIYNLIPQPIKGRIVTAKKYTDGHTDSATHVKNMVSNDKIWSPSYRECTGNTNYESSGVTYGLLSYESNRKKHKWNSSSNIRWWTRSGYLGNAYQACAASFVGSLNSGFVRNVTEVSGVCIGFCVA